METTCNFCGLTTKSPCRSGRASWDCTMLDEKRRDYMKAPATEPREPKPYTYPDYHFYEDGEVVPVPPEELEDFIKTPKHYARYAIEPKEFILANGLDFPTGNVIKYVVRHQYKNGKQDLEKAKEYIDWLIKHHYE